MLAKRAFLRWRRLAGQDPDLEAQMHQNIGELFPGWSNGIAPKVEGRVRPLSKDELETKGDKEGQPESDEHSKQTEESKVKKAKAVVVEGLHKLTKK